MDRGTFTQLRKVKDTINQAFKAAKEVLLDKARGNKDTGPDNLHTYTSFATKGYEHIRHRSQAKLRWIRRRREY